MDRSKAIFTERSDDDEDNKTVYVPFRVTPAEARILEDRCQGVDRSKYIRAVLFNGPLPRPRQVIPQVNRETYIALTRIGTNLNQQTKAINQALAMGLDPAFGSAYFETLAALQELLHQVCLEIAGVNSGEEAES